MTEHDTTTSTSVPTSPPAAAPPAGRSWTTAQALVWIATGNLDAVGRASNGDGFEYAAIAIAGEGSSLAETGAAIRELKTALRAGQLTATGKRHAIGAHQASERTEIPEPDWSSPGTFSSDRSGNVTLRLAGETWRDIRFASDAILSIWHAPAAPGDGREAEGERQGRVVRPAPEDDGVADQRRRVQQAGDDARLQQPGRQRTAADENQPNEDAQRQTKRIRGRPSVEQKVHQALASLPPETVKAMTGKELFNHVAKYWGDRCKGAVSIPTAETVAKHAKTFLDRGEDATAQKKQD